MYLFSKIDIFGEHKKNLFTPTGKTALSGKEIMTYDLVKEKEFWGFLLLSSWYAWLELLEHDGELRDVLEEVT